MKTEMFLEVLFIMVLMKMEVAIMVMMVMMLRSTSSKVCWRLAGQEAVEPQPEKLRLKNISDFSPIIMNSCYFFLTIHMCTLARVVSIKRSETSRGVDVGVHVFDELEECDVVV